MTHFLSETTKAIAETGHIPADIVFIGSMGSGHSCTWDEFQRLADFEYDAGFGAAHIAADLIVVFSDGVYLGRSEYDGAEGWEPTRPFVRPAVELPIRTLQSDDLWPYLADQQQDEDA